MAMSTEELAAYYAVLPASGGYDELCKMSVPAGIVGKRVLNLCCRSGKGNLKFCDAVGATGSVTGVDWRPDHVRAAAELVERERAAGTLACGNVQVVEAYPEQLDAAGLEPGSFHVVYVNSVLNLLAQPQRALAQAARVLKPGGMLVAQTVIATRPRDAQVVEHARAIGNAVQAAPHRMTLAKWLGAAGFDMPTMESAGEAPVSPSAGAEPNAPVPVVESDEKVAFTACTLTVRKTGSFDYGDYLRGDISEFR